ncbi:glycosyltransferase family 4 protein [Actinoplanes sp. N902-109]|uniref:glycosyltransferase family 4 protein n=1 Tax=Actinoplanes sp. (strain N902-109) TaxID=649831 RepID=UPI0003295F28|nr:glycosyltransferase family 4 protein [Actinoplanes sp. N902-109]AGL20840.1 group 1 glycosyl transferase [Actinoplanes sp. N902-109]
MKVAVLHNLTNGGAHRRLVEQVAALDADVVEFTTPHAVPVTARPFLVPLRVAAPHLPAVLRPPQRLLDLRQLQTTWRQLGDMAQRSGADVIYVNPDSTIRGAVSIGPSRIPVIRYCDEPRRIDYEPALQASLNPRTRALYAGLRRKERSIDRAALAEADAVATNSRYTAASILAAYGRTADVLPCGAPARMTADDSPPAHLLSVGSLIRSKGHDLVIEAAARSDLGLPVVVVAYHADPAEQERLHAVANAVGVRLSIRTGISDEELIGLYRRAFATLYLATAEPLGLVSIEAQACGSPVIVSDEGGLPETVAAEVTGIVVPRDAGAAAQALVRLSQDGLRRRMSTAAAAALNGHRWEFSASGLLAVADRLLSDNKVKVSA